MIRNGGEHEPRRNRRTSFSEVDPDLFTPPEHQLREHRSTIPAMNPQAYEEVQNLYRSIMTNPDSEFVLKFFKQRHIDPHTLTPLEKRYAAMYISTMATIKGLSEAAFTATPEEKKEIATEIHAAKNIFYKAEEIQEDRNKLGRQVGMRLRLSLQFRSTVDQDTMPRARMMEVREIVENAYAMMDRVPAHNR